jgi:hypothetical protein
VQAGLVRCYLRALAGRDTAGLAAVADNMPPVRITQADLAHSADARSGLATATFTQNPSDPENAFVVIRYADGAHDEVGIQNLLAMGGPSVWRMTIGTDASPCHNCPAPAISGPAPKVTASAGRAHAG